MFYFQMEKKIAIPKKLERYNTESVFASDTSILILFVGQNRSEVKGHQNHVNAGLTISHQERTSKCTISTLNANSTLNQLKESIQHEN